MTDYQTIGRETILEAATHQLKKMGEAAEVVLTSHYANPYIFEISLRRIGEHRLAEEFINPHPDLNHIVKRVHCKEYVLTAIITSLERGEREQAQEIESSQRKTFYLQGVGYIDPHYRIVMKPFEEEKEKLRLAILEKRGIEEGQRSYNEEGTGYSRVSLTEGIYALYANLALRRNQHARRILDTFFDLYYDKKSDLFKYTSDPHPDLPEKGLADILRGMDIINDQRLKKMYPRSIDILMDTVNGIQKAKSFHVKDISSLYSIAFCLDHFNEKDKLEIVRKLLSDAIAELKSSRQEDDDRQKEYDKTYGDSRVIVGGDYYDPTLCIIGLALMGLEKGKPNWFYAP